MSEHYLITFLVAYLSFVVFCVGFALVLVGRSASRIVTFACALAALTVCYWIASKLVPGQNHFVALVNDLVSMQRTQCVATMLGISTAIPWLLILFTGEKRPPNKFVWGTAFLLPIAVILITASGGMLAAKPIISDLLPDSQGPNNWGGLQARMEVPGFRIERVAEPKLSLPIRVAIGDQDEVYISAQTGLAGWSGVVHQLISEPGESMMRLITVAKGLNNPYGLAIRNGDLYVSRATQYTQAKAGQLSHVDTGAVTRLRDLDGDGTMDYYEDVVTGLPGSQGPDYIHQNNGIVFDEDGSLYVAIGAHTDLGMTRNPFEGTVTKFSPDFSKHETFARGLRNPFGIVRLPNGELFCTDNDTQLVDSGDEINHIRAGQHYGHPYVLGNEKSGDEFVPPILISKAPLGGIAFTDAPTLPPEYRNCLYTVDTLAGEVFRVTLKRVGDTYEAKRHPFAQVPGAVDIAIDSKGNFFVISFEVPSVYRISYVGPSK